MIEKIIKSRKKIASNTDIRQKSAEEGGCGVTGFISSIPVRGRHIYEPSVQMHNRGNGKGGGIAALGLCPESIGVSQDILDTHYLLQLAMLDNSCLKEIEILKIKPFFDVHKASKIETADDFHDIEGLKVKPPDVYRYFVRVKKNILDKFIEENGFYDMPPQDAEDEFIYQNSIAINKEFYSSYGKQRAFVLSHGKNLMILKIVGYAEKVVQYYKLDDFKAHCWIAHQRYPTKGRVWHPGGAHPFIGLNEALVHNGDFANYYAVSEYLSQHGIYPQFLTDTEVSVLLFDLLQRGFKYPLEYTIEAMAPTTEHDFDLLPTKKQEIYKQIQSAHIHASPDGPWFFIIAKNNTVQKQLQLIGITDTSMLRPQVFALQENDDIQIGLVCSEKQAIDATLQNIASEDKRFCPVADMYWNARGGSATDGGSFIFSIKDENGKKRLECTDKFGNMIKTPQGQKPCYNIEISDSEIAGETVRKTLEIKSLEELKKYAVQDVMTDDFKCLKSLCAGMLKKEDKSTAIEVLTFLNDIYFDTKDKKRSAVLHIVQNTLNKIFAGFSKIDEPVKSEYRYIDMFLRDKLRKPDQSEETLVINAAAFPPEGENCDARLICDAYAMGWKSFICYGYRGQRFTGCGLSADSDGVKIDVYGSSGDYLGSGIDGLEIYVHGNAQDQVGQIMKRGKLVIFGDVGQTFMYGAKGGDAFVMGNAAGRPLINAVGRPRVVINGTCLDYLAESFMAGDPINGGGFVILNGIDFDESGRIIDLSSPYPGSNLFSLASGGAIYIRDPGKKVVKEQLNGGEFADLEPPDWALILPYLKENERLFGISVEKDLLTVKGEKLPYTKVYRKVQAVKLAVL